MGRIDDCNLNNIDPGVVSESRGLYHDLEMALMDEDDFQEFAKLLENTYHSHGHSAISRHCQTGMEGDGVMGFTEVAARDPVFYRWHRHLEQIMQRFRDEKLPSYSLDDFALADGITVRSIKTIVLKHSINSKKNLMNTLLTHEEVAHIKHSESSEIIYKRINHIPFEYKLVLRNPLSVKKKVIVRIWLGVVSETDREYKKDLMIEMDRFVTTLRGVKREKIKRTSFQSAATMKEEGATLRGLMDDIRDRRDTKTWCGFPHNLLVPRSLPKDEMNGKKFVLIAFVNDVDQSVTEGSDGVEHMICGHRDLATRIDDRPFGFPFDREIGFDLYQGHRFVADTELNIHFIQKKEDISSSVNRLVTAKLPIEAQISLEVETELVENIQKPGKANPTDKIPLAVTSEKQSTESPSNVKDPVNIHTEESTKNIKDVEKPSSERPTTTTGGSWQEGEVDFEWMDSWYRFWKLMHNYLH